MASLLHSIHTAAPSLLYVHCAASADYFAELKSAVPTIECFPERALLLARREDLVCVAAEVDPAYLDFLRERGLGPGPANVVVASRFSDVTTGRPLWETLLESPEALGEISELLQIREIRTIHPFIASRGYFELAQALSERSGRKIRVLGGDAELVAFADCKHNVRAAALDLGVPVAPGEVIDLAAWDQPSRKRQALRTAIQRQMGEWGRVIVRGASGAGGSATFIISDIAEMEEVARRISERRENRFYLVEAMAESTASPNIQIHIGDDDTVECVGISDQRLTPALGHEGNGYPSRAGTLGNMIQWALVLGGWLRDAGYRGIAGFDFVEYIDGRGARKAFFAELNPRVNGATYPQAVAERLGSSLAFVSGTIKTDLGSFSELSGALGSLLFSCDEGQGLVPYAPGCLAHGRCPFVALGSTRHEAEELYAEAELTLGGACV